MIIRSAKKDDLKECENILKIPEFELAGGGYLDAEIFANYLDKNYFLVAEEDKKIIACIIGEPMKAGVVMLWFFVVKEEYRGKGIGKKLIKQFENNCRKLNINCIVLYVPILNESTLEFYKKQKYNKGKTYSEFSKML